MWYWFWATLGFTASVVILLLLIRWVSAPKPYTIQGNVKRHRKSGTASWFVIDPVDGQRVYVNSTDDMYEDADGNVWRII